MHRIMYIYKENNSYITATISQYYIISTFLLVFWVFVCETRLRDEMH